MNIASKMATVASEVAEAPWAAHVRWAIEGETLFILDLRRDAYLSLPMSVWLARQTELAARGLLGACGPIPMKAPPPAQGPFGLLRALLWARSVLRRRALEPAAALLNEPHGESDDRTAALVARFRALRPLYPRAASCLFDSLALGGFLLQAGIKCGLVFGVRGGPFAAHAWLQKAGRILNDDSDYCAGFTRMRP